MLNSPMEGGSISKNMCSFAIMSKQRNVRNPKKYHECIYQNHFRLIPGADIGVAS